MKIQNNMSNEIVDLTLELHVDTDKAMLLSDDGNRHNAKWVPKSQIEYNKYLENNIWEISLPEWLATKNGWT